jgi:hypothetical protein
VFIIVQVSNSKQAISELEEIVGFPLRGFVEGTSLVPKKLQISIENLKIYLNKALNLSAQGKFSLWISVWSYCCCTLNAYILGYVLLTVCICNRLRLSTDFKSLLTY